MQLSERHLVNALELAGVLLFVTIAIPTIADPDLWGHLRFGLDILQSHRLHSIDPYSFTSDRPWINHEWLSEALMAAVYSVGGVTGLVTLKIVVVVAFTSIVWMTLRDQLVSPLGRFVGTSFAIVASLAVLHSIRPQLWSLLLTPVLLWVLTRARDKPNSLILVPVIFVAWVNLHGGWMIGLMLAGTWLSGGWFIGSISLTRTVMVGVATAAATLVNPYGYRLWLFIAETVSTSRQDITEWLPITNSPPYFVIWWVATVLLALAVWRGNRAPTLLAGAVLAYLSWKVQRVVPFFVLVAIWLALPTLLSGPWETRKLFERRDRWVAGGISVAALLAAGMAFGAQTRSALPCITFHETSAPDQSAAAAIKAHHLRGRMITPFNWGEFVIWHFGPTLQVSMDGRRETVYTDATLQAHRRFLQQGFAASPQLEASTPDYIWLPRTYPVTDALAENGWQPVITTSKSIVWSRKPATGQRKPSIAVDAVSGCFPGLS